MLPNLKRVRLGDEVATALRAAILHGELPPGTQLLQEKLCTELGVSRTPLREALRLLEEEGLLEVAPGRGFRVSTLDLGQALELYEVREAVDALAARLCAQRSTRRQHALLGAIQNRMDAAFLAQDPHAWFQQNLAFHEAVVAGAKNRYLEFCLPLLRLSAQRSTGVLNLGRGQLACAEHRTILAAITSRDPDAAEAAARRHIIGARELIESRLAMERAARANPGGDGAGPRGV